MYITNLLKHIGLVIRHKHRVLIHCARCGILWQGIIHDMSKFSSTELFESARYYQGNRSPIGVCRRATGVSYAWLHHKGRNKHHIEYWLDDDCPVTPVMPYEYAVECVCDKLAATKTYKGKDYSPENLMEHWERYGSKVNGNPKTMAFIERVFRDIRELGEKEVLTPKYMKATYKEIHEKDIQS